MASVELTEVVVYLTSAISNSTEVVSPVNPVPATFTYHEYEVASNYTCADVTTGTNEVQVNSHLVFGSHVASSDVFKNTIMVLISPPVLLSPELTLHFILVAEVSCTKQSTLPTPPF